MNYENEYKTNKANIDSRNW